MAKFQNRKKNYDGGNRPKLGGLRNGIFERAQAGDLGIEENQKRDREMVRIENGNGQNVAKCDKLAKWRNFENRKNWVAGIAKKRVVGARRSSEGSRRDILASKRTREIGKWAKFKTEINREMPERQPNATSLRKLRIFE